MRAGALRAGAAVVARLGPDGVTRLEVLRSSPPLGLRQAAGSLWMVGTAAGPLPGDRVTLRIDVGAGAAVTVRSTAATVALGRSGSARSELLVEAAVGAHGQLRWLPEPTVATAGCHHRGLARVSLAAGARLVWRDELVLGRHGEGPGRLTSRIDVESDGSAVLRQELRLGPGAPGWEGPAVTGGAGAVGMVVVFDPGHPPTTATCLGPECATLPLAAGGVLISAVAPGASELRRRLDAGMVAGEVAGGVEGGPVRHSPELSDRGGEPARR